MAVFSCMPLILTVFLTTFSAISPFNSVSSRVSLSSEIFKPNLVTKMTPVRDITPSIHVRNWRWRQVVVFKRRQGLDRVVFRELLHNAFDLVTEDTLMDRIFCVFDRTSCGSVRLDDWLCGLSVLLRGTLQEQTAFCFRVYDLNGDGYITRDEMFSLLK